MLLLMLGTGACSYQHYQSTFGNAAIEARQFNTLFVIFLVVCAVMYLAVVLFLFASILRRRRAGEANVVEDGRHHASSPLMRSAMIGWSTVVVVGLIGLAIASFFADRSMAKAAAGQKLSITITANQWWWRVRYEDGQAHQIFTSANEIHVPVGQPVRLELESDDVIHSFWVPQLAGKTDLIPGQTNYAWLQADRPGDYRGQCGEFCGAQHAHMALQVVAEPPAAFQAWWQAQLAPANPAPAAGPVAAGAALVQARCSACHTVRGTDAGGIMGPDLTHLASRLTIAGGTLPNDAQHLAEWISHSQRIKPGTRMPEFALSPGDLSNVVAYLSTLR
jgi:cytochrome c oxidase subunit 2